MPELRPTKACPECDGAGWLLYEWFGDNRSGLGGISPTQRHSRCAECEGTGEVEHDELCDCDLCYEEVV